jgi:DNA polymerase
VRPVAPPPPTPAPPAVAAATGDWGELRRATLACTKCRELARCRKTVVFGVGNPRAELMFIGEAPGADEDEQGEPFVGRAGQLLTKIIEAMGMKREEVYIANVLKCRPPDNRKPLPDEMANCLPYLLRQIELVQPKVIVALGATAMQGLLNIEQGITKLRGTWYQFHDIPIMPTFHPAYLLRNPPAKAPVWKDMKAVVAKLGRELPPTPQAR